MKLYLIVFLFFGLSFFSSCETEKIATLQVVNQTNCDYHIYDGVNTNGIFIGPVGAMQTQEFKISLEASNQRVGTFYCDPQCNTITQGETFGLIQLSNGITSTITLD